MHKYISGDSYHNIKITITECLNDKVCIVLKYCTGTLSNYKISEIEEEFL